MDADYIMLTILSEPGEAQAAFASRLSHFWTGMLRDLPDQFEQVYAEAIAFEPSGDRQSRSYLATLAIADVLEQRLQAAGLAHTPIDRDDLYTKYEATPSEWMQIEH